MTRQADVQAEVQDTKRRDALYRALEFSFVGALEFQGIVLEGISIKYAPFDCFLVAKAIVGGVHSVCFVNADTLVNCILRADSAAARCTLHWSPDKYHPSNS